MHIRIAGTGSLLPDTVLTNDMLASMVDTSDEWITSHTGIKERRVAGDMSTLDMAYGAAAKALRSAGVEAAALGFILCATFTADNCVPSLGCQLQHALGANCPAMDLNAACSGFMYALYTAGALMEVIGKPILIVGVEKLSRVTNWSDRATCVLVGDGAGAAVVVKGDGLPYMRLGASGAHGALLNIPGLNLVKDGAFAPSYFTMNGPETYKHATRVMASDAVEALDALNITAADIRVFIPHQANLRIIKTVAERLGVPMDAFYVNIDRYGNTSAATIPIAMDEVYAQGVLKGGDLLLLVAFGGGATSGCAVLRV